MSASSYPIAETTHANLERMLEINEAAVSVQTEKKTWKRRILNGFGVFTRTVFEMACLIVVLAVLSMIPIVQLIVLGYLLDLSARIAKSGQLRDGPAHLTEASRLVIAGIALYLASLPALMFGSWARAAELISAGNPQEVVLQRISSGLAMVAFIHILWAWSRGGRIRDYLWPAPKRMLREGWRLGHWQAAYRRFWESAANLEIPRLFWLGLRGIVGTLIWLGVPAIILIGATRQGNSGVAGLVGLFGALLMGWVLIYLPFLQTQFAVDNRFRSLFGIRRVRAAFRCSPLLFWFSLVTTYLLAIPPYLFKIEAVPREVAWLPAAVVVAFIVPGRVVNGWAMWRGVNRTQRTGWGWKAWRMLFRFAIPPVIMFYLLIVYITQFTSWHGLATWLQQHAVSLPVPFTGT